MRPNKTTTDDSTEANLVSKIQHSQFLGDP